MKLMLAVLLIATSVSAADLDPVVWTHTATTQQVYVACFWAKQFPRFDGSTKHLVLACPVATWQANPTKRTKILTGIRKWLAGDVEVSAAKVQAVLDDLADANIRLALTDDPIAKLQSWGLTANNTEAP